MHGKAWAQGSRTTACPLRLTLQSAPLRLLSVIVRKCQSRPGQVDFSGLHINAGDTVLLMDALGSGTVHTSPSAVYVYPLRTRTNLSWTARTADEGLWDGLRLSGRPSVSKHQIAWYEHCLLNVLRLHF